MERCRSRDSDRIDAVSASSRIQRQEKNIQHGIIPQLPAQTSPHYLHNTLEQPTLKWGQASTTTLAHYDLHTDTIVVSTIFKEAPLHLIDYVMYHEMLHKKHQYKQTGNRSHFHTAAFRKDEKQFNNAIQIEKELNRFVASQRRNPKKNKNKKSYLLELFRAGQSKKRRLFK
jgi:hypothetical protein